MYEEDIQKKINWSHVAEGKARRGHVCVLTVEQKDLLKKRSKQGSEAKRESFERCW